MLILISIILVLWSLGWSLRLRLKAPFPPKSTSVRAESISIIIPARNEAHNLPRLLESIQAQQNPPLEIIVMDDGSTDSTAEIARSFGAKVITSKPLPNGWRGKTWACHQGAEAAHGDHLCFIDADTWFTPNGLDSILSFYQGGVLSVGPWHEMRKAYEWCSLFFNLSMVAGTVPDGLFGQFMLVRKEAYHRAGGHQAVRSEVLENVHLQQHFSEAGLSTLSIPGYRWFHFRMYPSGIGELIEGWTKGFASGANRTPKSTLYTMVAWMIGLMTTAISLALLEQPIIWGLLYAMHVFQLTLLSRKVGSFPFVAAVFYPLPLIFFFMVFSWSAWKAGKDVTWKGRQINDA